MAAILQSFCPSQLWMQMDVSEHRLELNLHHIRSDLLILQVARTITCLLWIYYHSKIQNLIEQQISLFSLLNKLLLKEAHRHIEFGVFYSGRTHQGANMELWSSSPHVSARPHWTKHNPDSMWTRRKSLKELSHSNGAHSVDKCLCFRLIKVQEWCGCHEMQMLCT